MGVLDWLPLAELPTLRGVSLGSKLFFTFVIELELGPTLAEMEGGRGGGVCWPSLTSCLMPFGAEAVYIRIPMIHRGETSFTLHRNEFEPTQAESEKQNADDDDDT
jgi:hypothetical protein